MSNIRTKLSKIYRRVELRINFSIYKLFCDKVEGDVRYSAKDSGKLKVVFFAINESMWKYDGVFQLMMEDDRFDPLVVSYIYPHQDRSIKEQVQARLRTFFQDKGYPYVDMYSFETQEWFNIKEYNPAVVFYAQPYDTGYKQYLIKNLWKTTLFCYVPYCFQIEDNIKFHNRLLHNVAWKLFYPSELHKKQESEMSINNGVNIVVTGYPMEDEFKKLTWEDPWKIQSPKVKRIIWAPHHSILSSDPLHYSNFLEIADYMQALAMREDIQIAFKPHPVLKEKLYNLKGWGTDKTDEYYRFWDNRDNTFLAEGDYIGLFLSSDAMIHDSCSFMGEYLYVNKPAYFHIKHDPEPNLNEFGRLCLSMHYKGQEQSDIESFIDNVVIGGKDTLLEKRKSFFSEYLIREDAQSVSHIIFDEVCDLFN